MQTFIEPETSKTITTLLVPVVP